MIHFNLSENFSGNALKSQDLGSILTMTNKNCELCFVNKGLTCLIPFLQPSPNWPLCAANRTTLEKLDKKPVASKPEQPIEAKAPAKPQGADTVNLSNVKKRIDDQPDFDRAKVDAIKAAIAKRQLPGQPRRIAENFVSLEKMIQG